MENQTITDASEDMFSGMAKSSVKLIKNSRGINWEIKVVKNEEDLIDALMKKAVETHKNLIKELVEVEE